MIGVLLGLAIGSVLCIVCSVAVHKMIEFGKKNHIVKVDEEDEYS